MNRFLSAVLIALVISLALFWLMQAMILNNQHGLKMTDNLQMIEFVRLKKETRTQIKERKQPDPPPPKKRPPPPKPMTQNTAVKNEMPDIDMPNIDIPLQSSRFKGSLVSGIQVGQGAISTNVIPLVRIPPRYPMRAASRKIEGWVKVEFTITETGTVKDAVVVESQPKGTFDRAALRAIAKWKFKAKIIDGEAFEQRAIQILEFKLSK